MRYPVVCPDCGAPRMDNHHERGNAAVTEPSQSETQFARVLNGLQWREKPVAPPRYRDDVVPND